MTLNEEEIRIGMDADEQSTYGFRYKHVKECFERIEFRLLKKFKMASVPIMRIIREEAGEALTSPFLNNTQEDKDE